MNEVIKQDESALLQEERDQEKKEKESQERSKYLDFCKNSKKFQKYIVKEVLEEALESTYNLDNIPINGDPKETGLITVQYKLARAGFKKSIDKLKR